VVSNPSNSLVTSIFLSSFKPSYLAMRDAASVCFIDSEYLPAVYAVSADSKTGLASVTDFNCLLSSKTCAAFVAKVNFCANLTSEDEISKCPAEASIKTLPALA